jgi:carbon-monoxide dehydrogenase medium subunit
MWNEYISAASIDEVLRVLADRGSRARIIAGGTDLILELERGSRTGIDTLIDVTRIPGIDTITRDEDGIIHLGAIVTHNDCAASKLLQDHAYPLARAAWEVGAPQIRNRATVAGNLITASPANDTITPLMALGASVELRSLNGSRKIPLAKFYTGVRKNIMRPDEMLVDISFPETQTNQRGTFIKLALRRAQAISIVNVALILTLNDQQIESASITLGAVAPTIIHARSAEEFLEGKELNADTIDRAAELAMNDSKPIDDLRGSAAYRREMARVITRRGLRSILDGQEKAGFPFDLIVLAKDHKRAPFTGAYHADGEDIITSINGKVKTFSSGQEKTLLRLLREDGELIGTKEGCAEGECGACTVFLDGKAVMACLVPAPRAHGAEIVTVEGLANGDQLHPVQEAFIQDGAVQCGYCSPGFLMSAAMLLEEREHPSRDEIEQALTGNLCRCTGYYKIVQAIENASQK